MSAGQKNEETPPPRDMPRRARAGVKLESVRLASVLPACDAASAQLQAPCCGSQQEPDQLPFAADGSPNDPVGSDAIRFLNEGSDMAPQEFFRPTAVGKLFSLHSKEWSVELNQAEQGFSLGRHKSNSHRVADSRISGLHCSVSCDQQAQAYYLQDHSHNGSWLRRGDKKWLLKRTRVKLQDGDVFSVISCYSCPAHGPSCMGVIGEECLQTEDTQTGPSFRFTLEEVWRSESPDALHAERPENPALREDMPSPKESSSSNRAAKTNRASTPRPRHLEASRAVSDPPPLQPLVPVEGRGGALPEHETQEPHLKAEPSIPPPPPPAHPRTLNDANEAVQGDISEKQDKQREAISKPPAPPVRVAPRFPVECVLACGC